jgi:DNA-binding NarL/FixJ family response regulator
MNIYMTDTKTAAHNAAETRKRILLVEDHPLMREGLRATINGEADLVVIGEAENADQAVQVFQKLAPDLALVDITLPGRSGIELVKDLKAIHPRAVILAISMHDESLYAERMLRAGASGYITKNQPPAELLQAIRQVLDNRVYVSRQVSDSLLRRISGKPRPSRSSVEMLTDREFEVFQFIGEGKSCKEIAAQLHISVKTVAVHGANIRKKLNLPSTAHLIRFAVQSEESKSRSAADSGS